MATIGILATICTTVIGIISSERIVAIITIILMIPIVIDIVIIIVIVIVINIVIVLVVIVIIVAVKIAVVILYILLIIVIRKVIVIRKEVTFLMIGGSLIIGVILVGLIAINIYIIKIIEGGIIAFGQRACTGRALSREELIIFGWVPEKFLVTRLKRTKNRSTVPLHALSGRQLESGAQSAGFEGIETKLHIRAKKLIFLLF